VLVLFSLADNDVVAVSKAIPLQSLIDK